MSISVVLGQPPFMQFTDNNGTYLAYGKMYTYDWFTREPKATWVDPEATIQYSNPIILDGLGRTQGIFFETDSPYYLQLTDANNIQIYASPKPYIPGNGGSGELDEAAELNNLFINSQFRFFPIQVYSPVPNSISLLANGGWSFVKDGTNSTDTIQFQLYDLDDTSVSPPSVYALNYTATGAGSGETQKDFIWQTKDVRTLANEMITISGNFISKINGTFSIEIGFIQNFGTGGSPSGQVKTAIGSFTISTEANYYNVSGTIPSLVGKTLGTNGDDFFGIYFRLPLNVAQSISMVNLWFKRGNPVDGYPYQTYEETLAQIEGSEAPEYNQKTDFPNFTGNIYSEFAYDVPMLIPNNGVLKQAWYPSVPPGAMMDWLTETPPDGWLLCEGQTLLNWGKYNRLFKAIIDGSGGTSFWGQPVDNTTASLLSNTLTVTNTLTGAVGSPPSAGTSPFTVTLITPGSGGVAQVFTVTTTAASSIQAGQYFTFNIVSVPFYCWFTIDGNGTDPAFGGKIGLRFDLKSTDTAAQIGSLLLAALKPIYFFNVFLNGVFSRVWDHGAGNDPDAASRTAWDGTLTGDRVGTFEQDAFKSHSHPVVSTTQILGSNTGLVNVSAGSSTNVLPIGTGIGTATAVGGNETRPVNVYLAKIIKY